MKSSSLLPSGELVSPNVSDKFTLPVEISRLQSFFSLQTGLE